jgi:hypothetical protein
MYQHLLQQLRQEHGEQAAVPEVDEAIRSEIEAAAVARWRELRQAN